MYEYKALIRSVYDGDGAFDAVIDLGMKIKLERKIRLAGVDTPELRGHQREAGRIVRDFVREMILGKEVRIHTHKDESGKYGRLLATIYIEPTEAVYEIDTLNELLIEMGYAKRYTGAKKDPWSREELKHIIKNKRSI